MERDDIRQREAELMMMTDSNYPGSMEEVRRRMLECEDYIEFPMGLKINQAYTNKVELVYSVKAMCFEWAVYSRENIKEFCRFISRGGLTFEVNQEFAEELENLVHNTTAEGESTSSFCNAFGIPARPGEMWLRGADLGRITIAVVDRSRMRVASRAVFLRASANPGLPAKHYGFVCGGLYHHLFGIGVSTGMYECKPRNLTSRMIIIGRTRLSDDEIVFICRAQATGSQNLSFRNCYNFTERVTMEICEGGVELPPSNDVKIAQYSAILFVALAVMAVSWYGYKKQGGKND